MKNLYMTCAFFIAVLSVVAQKTQKEVRIQFNHLADSVLMEYNDIYEDWEGSSYFFSRCQMYVSEISITHNSGEVLNFTDQYLLVDPEVEYFDMGTHEIGTIESITFHVGVPQSVNHNDPTTYPTDHPLYPQVPTMHWGWSAGYRFIALEGKSDTDGDNDPDKVFEYHAVGNQYYTQQVINTPGEVVGNTATVYIDFIYQHLLDGIDIENTLSVHGDGPTIDKMFDNIVNGKKSVFTAGDSDVLLTAPVTKEDLKEKVVMYPNPSQGNLTINYTMPTNDPVNFSVFQLNGQTVYTRSGWPSTTQLTMQMDLPPGVYLLQLSQKDEVRIREKWIVIE